MTTMTNYLLKDRYVESADSIVVELARSASIAYPASCKVIFHLVLQGSVFVGLDGGDVMELKAGDYALLFYGKAHRLYGSQQPKQQAPKVVAEFDSGDEPTLLKLAAGEKCAARVVSCALSLVHSIPNRAACPIPDLLTFTPHGGEFYSGRVLLTDLAQIAEECKGPGASAFLCALANLHMFQAIRKIHDNVTRMYQVNLGVPMGDTITASLKLMRMHPEKHWTVQTLAQELGLSRASFAAKFKTHLGVGPMEYLTQLRMKYAVDILTQDAEMPLWEVSRRAGYKSEHSFSRAFKAHFGTTPRAFPSAHGTALMT